jgi:hypothetical protein
MYCNNCGSQITCGCQKRTASNGVEMCSSCIVQYEAQLVEDIKERERQQSNNNK